MRTPLDKMYEYEDRDGVRHTVNAENMAHASLLAASIERERWDDNVSRIPRRSIRRIGSRRAEVRR